MRYVVVSSNTEARVRVFGTFRDREKAIALAERVNDKVERQEEADFDAWRGAMEGPMPEGFGRCHVLIVHKWSAKRAFRFALGDNAS